ncbi:MAG: hypothetical protein HY581_07075 [Nitrospirae bacterium]|nr:hypothetical protein [Nitrospirota bacterium]
MTYLEPEQVLFLHDRLIEETGGEHGVRDLGGLEQVNRYRLTATNAELEAFTLHVTTDKPNLVEIAGWFRTNTRRARTR